MPGKYHSVVLMVCHYCSKSFIHYWFEIIYVVMVKISKYFCFWNMMKFIINWSKIP